MTYETATAYQARRAANRAARAYAAITAAPPTTTRAQALALIRKARTAALFAADCAALAKYEEHRAWLEHGPAPCNAAYNVIRESARDAQALAAQAREAAYAAARAAQVLYPRPNDPRNPARYMPRHA